VARVLIQMRAAIMRRATSGSRWIGVALLVLLVTLLAVITLLAGLVRYRDPGAGADVVATLSLGWLLGWTAGPLLTGDDAALRMDYFKLLPIPPRRRGRRPQPGAALAGRSRRPGLGRVALPLQRPAGSAAAADPSPRDLCQAAYLGVLSPEGARGFGVTPGGLGFGGTRGAAPPAGFIKRGGVASGGASDTCR
jgi:hypothetical protein